jgi:hypothetical protein
VDPTEPVKLRNPPHPVNIKPGVHYRVEVNAVFLMQLHNPHAAPVLTIKILLQVVEEFTPSFHGNPIRHHIWESKSPEIAPAPRLEERL